MVKISEGRNNMRLFVVEKKINTGNTLYILTHERSPSHTHIPTNSYHKDNTGKMYKK